MRELGFKFSLMKGAKPLTKTKGGKMFVSDSLDYQLDYQSDQMRWEYERAMWEQAQIKNKERGKKHKKEQAKRTKRLKRVIEKAINKTKGLQ